MSIIAVIPYYRCPDYICRAVESLLSQTLRDLTIVVLNDGDTETPPWPHLAHISDPRLVRADLGQNRGPYFALQVALDATQASYLLIQDSDDWSEPDRVEKLWKAIENDHADVAISAQHQFREVSGGVTEPGVDYCAGHSDLEPGENLKLRMRHHGLFRVETLKSLGGYYGGFKMSYDMFVTNLLLLTGRVAVVADPVYNYFRRQGSLTTSPDTGMKSEARRLVEHCLREQYRKAYTSYLEFVKGRLTASAFFNMLKRQGAKHISADVAIELQRETRKLSDLLRQAA